MSSYGDEGTQVKMINQQEEEHCDSVRKQPNAPTLCTVGCLTFGSSVQRHNSKYKVPQCIVKVMYSNAAWIIIAAMQEMGKRHNPEMFRFNFCLT